LFLTAIIEIKNEMAEKKAKNKAGD
jgi:hypothetical protein